MSIKAYPSQGGGYSVSQNQQWVNGIFDTEKTARRACKYTNAQLEQISDVWSVHGQNRPATMEDLHRIETEECK